MRLFNTLCAFFALSLLLTVSDVKAQKNFGQEADKAYETEQYSVAIDLYKEAYNRVKKNKAEKNRILYRLAECYRATNNSKQAINWFQRVTKSGYPDPLAYLYLADAFKAEERYPEAIVQYDEFTKLKPDDPRGKYGKESCELAQSWLDDPTRYVVENMKKFNSKSSDFSPYWADKNYKALLFTSAREGSTGNGSDGWTGQAFSDIYIVTQDKKGAWSEPLPADENINTEVNEGNPWLNKKANVIYFTRCPIVKKQKIGCQIYYAKKQGKGWAPPDTLQLAPDMSYAVGHPTLSDDELTIYFSSDMPGGYGGKDIWMATRTKKTKPFDKPVNLGATVNTDGNEMFPYLRDDGVLFYSSDALSLLGMGGLDIYKVTKEGDKWGKPVNLQSPLNSAGDDFGIIFKGNKEEGFLTSNRKGGRGDDDIWSFYLPPMLFTLQGVVRDDSTKQIISGAWVKLVGSDGTVVEDSTGPDGMYHFGKTQILENTSYELSVTKNKYFGAKGRETTVGLRKSTDLVHDFNLAPIPPVPVVLPDVLYVVGKWDLTPAAIDSLNWLVNILKDNPRWVIELSSHTDIRPIPITNDTLSKNRAISAYKYLVSQGIQAERIKPTGYGANRPRLLDRDKSVILDPKKYPACKTAIFFPKGTKLTPDFIKGLKTTCEKEAAHQLNRRTEFVVLSEDFVPTASNDTSKNVTVQVNPMDNVVTILPGASGTFEARMVINSISMDFKYEASEEKMSIDADKVMALMKEYRITINDFKDKEKALNEDGTIKENAIVNLKKVVVGKKIVTNVEAVVVKGLNPAVLIGSKTLDKFGSYSVDEEKRQLIFDDPNAPAPAPQN
jgi:peptidoglycan-associated lipoprotein